MSDSLDKKVGQRFIFGVNNENVADIINLIRITIIIRKCYLLLID